VIKVQKLDEIRIAPPKKRGRPRKYNNNVEVREGERWDSDAEWFYYLHLKELEREGEIHSLLHHVTFHLIPTMRGEYRTEYEWKYEADFTYTDKNGKYHVVDVKGKETEAYKAKRRAMLYFKGISIEEVSASEVWKEYKYLNDIYELKGRKIEEV
jgi:hypothetical protein